MKPLNTLKNVLTRAGYTPEAVALYGRTPEAAPVNAYFVRFAWDGLYIPAPVWNRIDEVRRIASRAGYRSEVRNGSGTVVIYL